MQALFRTIIRHYLCRKSAIFNKVCSYSCMGNKEVCFVVDTSCKMALIHQAVILHLEMIHHACISKVFFSFLVNLTWFLFRFAVINAEMTRNFSVMHGFICNAVLKLLMSTFVFDTIHNVSFLKSSRGNFHDWKILLQWQCPNWTFLCIDWSNKYTWWSSTRHKF